MMELLDMQLPQPEWKGEALNVKGPLEGDPLPNHMGNIWAKIAEEKICKKMEHSHCLGKKMGRLVGTREHIGKIGEHM